MFRKILGFFDELEDVVRGRLSHWPIVYTFFGGIGVVLFWRGLWHTVDWIVAAWFYPAAQNNGWPTTGWLDGPLSFAIGIIILLMTGLFVSNFIGNEIIISGLKREKKLVERTEDEVTAENVSLFSLQRQLKEIRSDLAELKEKKSKRRV